MNLSFSKSGYRFAIAKLIGFCCFAALGITAPARVNGQQAGDSSSIVRRVVEAPQIYDAAISPRGDFIVYCVAWRLVETNQRWAALYLQRLDSAGKPTEDKTVLAKSSSCGASSVQWVPDGKSVSFFGSPSREIGIRSSGLPTVSTAGDQLLRYWPDTREISAIVPRPIYTNAGEAALPQSAPGVKSVGQTYRWSPKGNYIVFTQQIVQPATFSDRTGMVQTEKFPWRSGGTSSLMVLEVATGAVSRVLLDDELDIAYASMSWSPDETEIAFSATRERGRNEQLGGVLGIVVVQTGVVRILSQRNDTVNPQWSPDGRAIAFSKNGRLSLAQISSPTSSTFLSGENDPGFNQLSKAFWSQDSRYFYYSSSYHMASQLVRADSKSGSISFVTELDDNFSDESPSYTADGSMTAFIRSSLLQPDEVYVMKLPDGEPRRITELSTNFNLGDGIKVERISWQAKDGFITHAMLLTPKSAWNADGKTVKRPLPLIVHSKGGPSQVGNEFDATGGLGTNSPVTALALNGYAVLFPNTRGRGGYGNDGHGQPNTFFSGPFLDLITGLDLLVSRGIANPNRLGFSGHSAGAQFGTYTLTRTNRFKTALIHEGVIFDLSGTDYDFTILNSAADRLAARYGLADPLSKETKKVLWNESYRYWLGNISTPALLMFGSGNSGHALEMGDKIYGVMTRKKVPVEYVVYSYGHGPSLPSHMEDNLIRCINWFNFWLLGTPYPDKVREKEFNVWKGTEPRKTWYFHLPKPGSFDTTDSFTEKP